MSYAKPKIEPDIKIPRPTSRLAKLAVIRETFAAQPFCGWCAAEQNYYLQSIGLEPTSKNKSRTDAEIDLILSDLERHRMVLFK